MSASNQHSMEEDFATIHRYVEAVAVGLGGPPSRELYRAARRIEEQLEAAHTALRMWVAMVEGSEFLQIKPSYEPLVAALHETDAVLGSNPASRPHPEDLEDDYRKTQRTFGP